MNTLIYVLDIYIEVYIELWWPTNAMLHATVILQLWHYTE